MEQNRLSSSGLLALRIFLLAVAYYIGGKLGLSMPYLGSNITLFWPPAGIALAAVLVWGMSCWPGIFLGALAVNLSTGDLALPAALAIAAGNSVGPILGAFLLKHWTDLHSSFARPRDIPIFALIASSCMLLPATLGVMALYTSGKLSADFIFQAWLGWWIGDTVGVLVFAPPLLLLSVSHLDVIRQPRLGAEFVLALSACGALAWLVFGDVLGLGHLKVSLAFLVFPPLIWIILRFEALEASIAALVISIGAVWGTSQGFGPFAKDYPQFSQLILCIFVATVLIISYVISSIKVARHHAEHTLRDSESRLRLALAAANQGLWDFNIQTGETTVSAEYALMMGYDPETFEETVAQWRNRIHPEDRDLVYRIYQDYIAGLRENYQVEYRQQTRQGDWKWILSLGKVVKWDDQGRPLCMMGTLTDISSRKQAEEEINQARILLRTVIDATPDWIFVKDRQHRFLLVNEAFAKNKGLEPAQMIGRPDTDFWHPILCYGDPAQGIRGFHADDDDAFSGNATHNPADSVTLADGQQRWFDTIRLPMRPDRGEVIGVLAYARDISEQKNSEQALREALEELQVSEGHQRDLRDLAEREQRRMGALLSAMSLGILFEDSHRKVEYVNPAFLRMWLIDENLDLLGMPTKVVLERSTERFGRPAHASKYVLNVMHTHEVSERFELELSDGRILAQLSYPVTDTEGRILGRLWIYEDITQERQTAQQLLYLAERDPLTGLYNRHRFQGQIETLIAATLRNRGKFALLYFDLDDFKYINDTFGHSAGDTVLVKTAGEISSVIRHVEIFARLGGDEFALLSIVQQGDDISALPARIVSAIASIPLRFRSTNIRLTSSVGVAIFPEHGETAEDLVAHADTAMYQAKTQGKNTWAIYDSSRNASQAMMQRMSWRNLISQALEHDYFELHFQGVYAAADRTLSHVEVLIRMRDPNQPDCLMPGQFIPIAEKSGQILDIDRWVIKQTIKTLANDILIPPLAINISGRSFDEPSLPSYIRQVLTEYSVESSRLIIELTETAAVTDIQDAQRFIEAIQQSGCKVCLDDFGSGFSTFSYLKYLGVEILKIDGLFISDLANNRDNQVFVKAMVDVAQGLGKKTVAEYVEDEATFSMIKKLGIDFAQGYYFGRPSKNLFKNSLT